MFDELEFDDDIDDDLGGGEPYASKSEGLLPPPQVQNVLGHDEQEQLILSLYNQDKLPHGIAFTGTKGIGKASFAYRLTKFLFHDNENATDSLFGGDALKAENFNVPQDSNSAHKVASLGHPDLLVIELPIDDKTGLRKNTIPVESIREIAKFMHSTAAMGGWRICLIDDADLMTNAAQNALLKILEEPPHKVLIILVAHRMGHFLPTIKSRLRVMPFKPLAQENIDALLSRSGLDVHNKALIHCLSEGSIGTAIELAEQEDMEVTASVFNCFHTTTGLNRIEVMKLSEFLSMKKKEDDGFPFFVMLMTKIAAELVRLKAMHKSFYESLLFTALRSHPQSAVLENYFNSQDLQFFVANYDRLRLHFDEGQRAYLDRHHLAQEAFEILIGNRQDGS
jgi:DNA polymerase-3 subunit delta'